MASSVAADDLATQHRFESFRFGRPLSDQPVGNSHRRSHSRNVSSSTDLSTMSAPPSKRNSHHRRRSSVSTRHESAEMMGIALPDPPEGDNLAEKDSIRRRALWALEGKADASFTKVEIPELSTPEIEKKLMFDFPSRPSFPPGSAINTFGAGLMMSGKRDSFKLLSVTSSKDQLGTLLEEEEEDEESPKVPIPVEPMTPQTPNTPPSAAAILENTPSSRPRPHLRPLSLTPENLMSHVPLPPINGLPTPSVTPAGRQGLKSLSLLHDDCTKSQTKGNDASSRSNGLPTPTPTPRRPILNLHISPEPLPILVSSSASSASSLSSAASDDVKFNVPKPQKRSSISYISSNNAGLPTPEMTPTFSERRCSTTSTSSMSSSNRSSICSNSDSYSVKEEDSLLPSHHQSRESRSGIGALTASEQHFLFKSHNALLARITDLERALSVKKRESIGFGGSDTSGSISSRPMSMASDVSSVPGEPTDEMLRLVSDLKAERDELKRDVDGWRTRVADLEKQINMFIKRVENERRDAWVARNRLGLVEVEKSTLMRDLEGSRKRVDELREVVENLERENAEMKTEKESVDGQNARLMKEMGEMKLEVQRLTSECARLKLEVPRDMATPTAQVSSKRQGFLSGIDDGQSFGFALNAVKEGTESDDDNGLAGYEDEDPELEIQSSVGSSSSLGSMTDFPRSFSHLQLDVPSSPITPLTPKFNAFEFPSRPTHRARASLSKTWTFPRGAQPAAAASNGIQASEPVDKFFGCLDDSTALGIESEPPSVGYVSYETSKDMFARALVEADDDDFSPFVLPSHIVGTIVSEDVSTSPSTPSTSSRSGGLLAVLEEEEEEEEEDSTVSEGLNTPPEDDMFGDVGGITITFTPPQAEDERPLRIQSEEPATPQPANCDVRQTPALITPPKSIPRSSSIPRASPVKPVIESPVYPLKLSSPRFGLPSPTSSATVTPPSKRPSFIPQPVTPPSPVKQRPTSNTSIPRTTFIRQPVQRKPLTVTSNSNAPSPLVLNDNGNGALTCKSQLPTMHYPRLQQSMVRGPRQRK